MIEEILSEIDGLENEVAFLCSELIQCRSDYPEARTDSCVALMEKYFDELGIVTEVFEKEEGKPNIVARIGGDSGKKIIWLGHNDVVPIGDPDIWKYPPFSGTSVDGKVYGRGASDMKGSNASAMIAAKILSEYDPPCDIDFWFTADEEIGGTAGARWLAENNYLEGDVAIIGDSSGCDPGLVNIGLGNKGGMGCRIYARGKTAHGSTPYLGDNAIDKLLDVIPYVRMLGDYELELPDEIKPVIKSTTQYMLKDDALTDSQREEVKKLFTHPSGPSLNIINGGVKINVVPDFAEARFDIRLTPGADASKVKERLDELISSSRVSGVTLEARVSSKVGYHETIEEVEVQKMVKAVQKVTGEVPYYTIAPWGTDAVSVKRNVVSQEHPEGIPCILFGPMDRDQLHQPNEYVTISNLVTAAKVYSIYPFYYN